MVAMTGDSYLKSSVAFHVASQCKIMRHDRGAPAKLCLGGDFDVHRHSHRRDRSPRSGDQPAETDLSRIQRESNWLGHLMQRAFAG